MEQWFLQTFQETFAAKKQLNNWNQKYLWDVFSTVHISSKSSAVKNFILSSHLETHNIFCHNLIVKIFNASKSVDFEFWCGFKNVQYFTDLNVKNCNISFDINLFS